MVAHELEIERKNKKDEGRKNEGCYKPEKSYRYRLPKLIRIKKEQTISPEAPILRFCGMSKLTSWHSAFFTSCPTYRHQNQHDGRFFTTGQINISIGNNSTPDKIPKMMILQMYLDSSTKLFLLVVTVLMLPSILNYQMQLVHVFKHLH